MLNGGENLFLLMSEGSENYKPFFDQLTERLDMQEALRDAGVQDLEVSTIFMLEESIIMSHPVLLSSQVTSYTNYTINLESPMCARDRQSALYIVHTSPNHQEFRNIIRDTWGDQDIMRSLDASVIFFVGRSDDVKAEYRIKQESEQFGDIVQGGNQLNNISND